MTTPKHDKRKRIHYGMPIVRPHETSSVEWQELWNVPDWRDPESTYPNLMPEKGGTPSTDYITRDQMRWEFMRRDSDYRELWEDYQNGELEVENYDATDIDPLNEERYNLHKPEYKWLRLFDLNLIIDPRIPGDVMPRTFYARWKQGRRMLASQSVDIGEFIADERYAIILYDIHRPLEDQLDRANATLVKLQSEAKTRSDAIAKLKSKRGNRRGKGSDIPDVIITKKLSHNYSSLLRILDGVLDGASVSEICKGIRPTEASEREMRDRINTALQLWERL
jgi:hypothetical protein